jgi:hypothetical protein
MSAIYAKHVASLGTDLDYLDTLLHRACQLHLHESRLRQKRRVDRQYPIHPLKHISSDHSLITTCADLHELLVSTGYDQDIWSRLIFIRQSKTIPMRHIQVHLMRQVNRHREYWVHAIFTISFTSWQPQQSNSYLRWRMTCRTTAPNASVPGASLAKSVESSSASGSTRLRSSSFLI